MIRLLLALTAVTVLCISPDAYAATHHHKHHAVHRATVPVVAPTETLDLVEAAYAIETQSVKNWNTPGVEAAVSECHYLAHPWEVQCVVDWTDPSWVSPICGRLVISGLDTAILEDGHIDVYAA